MIPCPIFDGSPGGPCCWCRRDADDHAYRWCPSCRGDRFVPDLTDRVAQRQGLPLWAWRQVPCRCRGNGRYLERRGGIVTPDGTPVDDAELNAAGIN